MGRHSPRTTWSGLAIACGILSLATPTSVLTGPAWQASASPWDRFLAFLVNPNTAYLLLVLGLLGLIAEFATAGTVFPGVVGTICLILALIGLGQLPTNWGGAALILAGLGMMLLDLKVTGMGLTIGGLVAFGLGSLLIFTPPWAVPAEATTVRLNPWLIVGTTACVALFFLLGVSAALKAHLVPVAMGRELVVGKRGTVLQELRPRGIVHLEGEEWSAVTLDGAAIPVGAAVRVVATEGLTLRVEPVEEQGSREAEEQEERRGRQAAIHSRLPFTSE